MYPYFHDIVNCLPTHMCASHSNYLLVSQPVGLKTNSVPVHVPLCKVVVPIRDRRQSSQGVESDTDG